MFQIIICRLWHQLTLTCEAFYRPSAVAILTKQILISIFKEFIEKWSKKMNQLSFTQLAVKVSELLGKMKLGDFDTMYLFINLR